MSSPGGRPVDGSATLVQAPIGERHAVHFSSASPEWYTPAQIVERVVGVLGRIDLDPCAEGGPYPTIPAQRSFTAADDGLRQPWSGRLYMNPPYGRQIGRWVDKLCAAYAAGDIAAAIALLPARTDTAWFQHLAGFPVCFVRGRRRFSGHANGAPFPSAVVYLGPDLARFIACFAELGVIRGGALATPR